MISPKFFGSNMIWWFGVVEENDDSTAIDKLKLGRCRVRIIGLHSPQLAESDTTGEGIAVDQLLWAYPITPITSAAMNGIGDTPLGVVCGSVVFGFSFDGVPSQDLYILGTMGGVPAEIPPENQGFRDPNGVYPKPEHIGEPDTNRLARNENIDKTCVEDRRNNLTKNIPHVSGKTWNEPESSYDAEYPYNHVRETVSGHIEEFDDTPGSERYHRWHPTGSYVEIDADGNEIHKIIGNGFEIIVKDKNLYVHGDINITVGGDANILVQGNGLINVDKSLMVDSKEDIQLHGKNIILIADKKIDVSAGTDFDLTAGRNNTQCSMGAVLIKGTNTIPVSTASGIV